MQAYYGLLNRANQVSQTPYQAYGGELTAGFNPEQQLGVSGINSAAGFASPYIQQAAQYANQAAQPISASQIEQYQSPYTQQVVDAMQKQFANTNAQQQSQVLGNAAAQGALGGDRAAVAQANLAGQQQAQEAPTIAGLYQSGYQNAQQMALSQQQAMAQGAYSLGNLGVAGQNAALQGAGAQLGAGGQQQQTQQARDTALYQQFMQQQAFPYQQLQWLAGLDTGVGSQMGGTSTTTGPPPNPFAQYAGLGVAALGAAAPSSGKASGGPVAGFAPGGMVAPMPGGMAFPGGNPGGPPMGGPAPVMGGPSPGPQAGFGQRFDQWMGNHPQWENRHPGFANWGNGTMSGLGGTPTMTPDANMRPQYDDGGAVAGFGGLPWGGASGWIPSAQITHGNGAPKPPSPPSQSGTSGFSAGSLAGAAKGLGAIGSDIGGMLGFGGEAAAGAGEFLPEMLPALALLKRGGRAGFAPGGDVDLSDAYPLGDIGPGTDFPFNPTRLDANRAYPEPMANVPLPRQRAQDSDVADLPPAANPVAGFAPVPGSPGAPAVDKGAFGGFGLSDAAKSGLMAAGLGMMASRSPFLGTAIGEGGLQGLSAYSGEKRQEASVESARKKLEQHAKETADRLALESKKVAQAEEARQRTPHVLGEDAYGNKRYGVFDPATKSWIDPVTRQPVKQEESADLPANSTPVAGEMDKAIAAMPPELRGPDLPRNEPFISTLPQADAATVKGLVNYTINPASLSIKGGHRERLIGEASQYDPTYDQALYPAKQKAINEFYAGGPMSPAGTLTAGNTAILHAADMSDALEKFKGGASGLSGHLGSADIPFLSHMANQFNNASVRGTSAGQALSQFETARQRFSEEVTKFYSGSSGSQAEREHALALLDSAKSLPELRAAIAQDAQLMKDKVAQLQNRLMTAMGPSAWRNALVRDPQSVLVYKNSQEAFDKINKRMQEGNAPAGNAPAVGAAPAGMPNGARQAKDGNWYVPDPGRPGKYLMVQP